MWYKNKNRQLWYFRLQQTNQIQMGSPSHDKGRKRRWKDIDILCDPNPNKNQKLKGTRYEVLLKSINENYLNLQN